MCQSPNPVSCPIYWYGSSHLETSLGCHSAMFTIERSPQKPRKKAHVLREAGKHLLSLEIYGGCCVQYRNEAGKYDFASIGYWCRRGSSSVWGPKTLPILPHKRNEAQENRTKSLTYYKINAHQCWEWLRCSTCGTKVAEKTPGNVHINTALLPAQNLQP